MPASYWAEALATATYLLNILPTKMLQFATPHFALHGSLPSYDHLRVFGCKCYPNLSATTAHKLAPRSVLCVFLGYSAHHKGYRCLDLDSNRVLISRHVVFNETVFPFTECSTGSASLDFLDDCTNTEPAPHWTDSCFVSCRTSWRHGASPWTATCGSPPCTKRGQPGSELPARCPRPRLRRALSGRPWSAALRPVVRHLQPPRCRSSPCHHRASCDTSTPAGVCLHLPV